MSARPPRQLELPLPDPPPSHARTVPAARTTPPPGPRGALGPVAALAAAWELTGHLEQALRAHLDPARADEIGGRLGVIPVFASRAARRLGSCTVRRGVPVAIRLQLAQSPEMLAETFLHEIAHALDHLSGDFERGDRRSHGPSWQRWARALGIPPEVTGHCEALTRIRARRVKPVARCERCGHVLHRLRRLARGRVWLHRSCGGRYAPL